ncbi:GNAT family N-acetyltransferase [Vibrio salinus]|uniref:GNAT family N-acetyltransferase n=1 Tax=Vibrio salinus TaxID=2899784 RepID=UPI001E4A2104|nr:GNAT family N-acetyltransferase [Vibrio salinus]MCE0492736.1 GNAT family N-acetyltransferase [Vibrio salinus]
MRVETAVMSDFESLVGLSAEVENLFGPMVNEASFHTALKEAIANKMVFCVRDTLNTLKGGIAISKEANAILWFVVAELYRGQGIGSHLLRAAISRLDSEKEIVVQTFDKTVQAGLAARTLYLNTGFVDVRDGGKNPAGIPTVIMHLINDILTNRCHCVAFQGSIKSNPIADSVKIRNPGRYGNH